MAAFLSPFKFYWKDLNTALNQIVDAVNRNAPLEGENIHLDEKGKQGTSINAVQSKQLDTSGQQQATGGGVTGTLQKVTLFDASGNPVTLNVWTDGNAPGTSSLAWQGVTTVDPASCAQSSLTVLTQPSS